MVGLIADYARALNDLTVNDLTEDPALTVDERATLAAILGQITNKEVHDAVVDDEVVDAVNAILGSKPAELAEAEESAAPSD